VNVYLLFFNNLFKSFFILQICIGDLLMKKINLLYTLIILVFLVFICGCIESSNDDDIFLIRSEEIVNEFYPVSFQKIVNLGNKVDSYISELSNYSISSDYDSIRDILIENLEGVNVVYEYFSEFGSVELEKWEVYLDEINDGFEQVLSDLQDITL
jgi:hypothetical protein